MSASAKDRAFLRDLIIIVLLVAGIAWAIARYAFDQELPLSFTVSFGILAIIAWFTYGFLVRANRKRPQIFVARFMGALSAKLFLSIIILVVAGLLDKENFKFTAIAYLIGYLLLSINEIRHLLPLVRKSDH